MTNMVSRITALVGVLLLQLALLAGCQQNQRAVADLPPLKIGVASVTQPKGTTDLLAGYIPEGRVLASPEALAAFDVAVMDRLRSSTKRTFDFIPHGTGVDPTAPRSAKTNSALAYWVGVAKANNVELLIVPQILDWQERQGGPAGVSTSAAVNMDFFLIDARDEGQLVTRSHFSEKQVGLSNDLTKIGTFFKRGGKWLSAQDMALEATEQMVREFGL